MTEKMLKQVNLKNSNPLSKTKFEQHLNMGYFQHSQTELVVLLLKNAAANDTVSIYAGRSCFYE